MRTIRSLKPRPELQPFVRVFAEREISRDEPEFLQPNMAALEQVLAFEVRDRMLLDYPAEERRRCPAVNLWGSLTVPFGGHRLRGHIIGFAIFLKPQALWQLFNLPAKGITNLHYDGEDLLGSEVQDLWCLLAECRDFHQRVHAAEAFLLPFAARAKAPTSIMKTARFLSASKGAVPIQQLAQASGLGVRQFERRFLDEMGCTPKLYARITRFQVALDRKRLAPLRSWLGIAHELGYFDQMHMVHDFHSLGGNTPGQIFQQSADLQPWSLGRFKDLDEWRANHFPGRKEFALRNVEAEQL